MISRTNFYFLPFLLLFSCGNQSINTTDSESNPDPLTIELSPNDLSPVPKIEDQQLVTDIGPAPKVDENFLEKKTKVTKAQPTAIVLGPGIYRTITHISLLRELNQKDQKPNLIIGHGLASVVAAYYAFGYKPDYIEWKFFKFFNEIDDEEPFSKSWIKAAQKYLLDELQKKRIEEGKLTLIVPIWNEKENKIQYLRRGLLIPTLLANLDHKGLVSKNWKPAFPYEALNKKMLLGLGIKKIYLVDLLSGGISWQKASGFYNGIYEKGAYQSVKDEQSLSGVIKYDLKDFKLDDLSRLADMVYKSKKDSREKIKSLSEEEKE